MDNSGQKFGIYQTVSKAYVFDEADIDIGDTPGSNFNFENPIILKKQFYKRGVLNEIIHKFNYDLSGLLAYDNGEFEVFYSNSKKGGMQKNLIKMGFIRVQVR